MLRGLQPIYLSTQHAKLAKCTHPSSNMVASLRSQQLPSVHGRLKGVAAFQACPPPLYIYICICKTLNSLVYRFALALGQRTKRLPDVDVGFLQRGRSSPGSIRWTVAPKRKAQGPAAWGPFLQPCQAFKKDPKRHPILEYHRSTMYSTLLICNH